MILRLTPRCLHSSQRRSDRAFLWPAANKGVKYDVRSMFSTWDIASFEFLIKFLKGPLVLKPGSYDKN